MDDAENRQTQVDIGGAGGATMIGWSMLNSGSGTAGSTVAAAADFDGNGVPDLIWKTPAPAR